MADFIRTRIIPLVPPTLFRFEAARDYMFSAVSQILVNYRDSAISSGKVGPVHGGDRLPWAPVSGADNFDTFRTIGWQVHGYGAPSAELSDWCKSNSVRLCVFPWQEAYEKSALSQNAIYLLRPDTYVDGRVAHVVEI